VNPGARSRVWLNGRLVPAFRARVSVFDRGFLFGDGVYETMRAYAGRPFRLAQHLDRLGASAWRLDLRLPGGRRGAARAVRSVLAANRLGDARVRVTVTRGAGPAELGKTAPARPTMLAVAVPYSPPSPREYREGVGVILARTRRNPREALDPAIKSNNLINNMLAKMEAARAGARDAIFLNIAGHLAEGSTSNVFLVDGGVLMTPALSCGILPGVTRAAVIGLARRMGMVVREGRFTPHDLARADEVFLTASTVELLPVGRIGRRRLPAARPVTARLLAGYRALVARELGLRR